MSQLSAYPALQGTGRARKDGLKRFYEFAHFSIHREPVPIMVYVCPAHPTNTASVIQELSIRGRSLDKWLLMIDGGGPHVPRAKDLTVLYKAKTFFRRLDGIASFMYTRTREPNRLAHQGIDQALQESQPG